jgi:hypothetical protein
MLASSLIIVRPVTASAAAAEVSNNAITFDSAGKYTDPLDNLDHVFYQSGINQVTGSVYGPGEMIYSAGDSGFKSISIDTLFNKWSLSLNFNNNDLSVYEVVYNAATGTFTNTAQVSIVRELRPDLMADKDNVKATYVSGPITPGTKYLRFVLPSSAFFSSTSKYPDFKLDAITLANSAYTGSTNELMVDNLSDFSHFASGVNTSNLIVIPNTTLSNITFMEPIALAFMTIKMRSASPVTSF